MVENRIRTSPLKVWWYPPVRLVRSVTVSPAPPDAAFTGVLRGELQSWLRYSRDARQVERKKAAA